MKFKPSNKRGSVVVEIGEEAKRLDTLASPGGKAVLPAFTLKKILVGVDFSDLSRKAVQYGVAFARLFEAELTLLHVVQPYPVLPEMAPVDIESLEDSKRDLESLRTQVGDAIRCHTLLRRGDSDQEIITAAEELGSDLIIVGTHGRSALAHLVLGGTAEKVVRHATCPVLVVRQSRHDFVPATMRDA